MIKYKVTLTQQERGELLSTTKSGTHTAKRVIHALILLHCDEGEFADKVNNEDVAKVLKVGMRTIDRVKKKFECMNSEAKFLAHAQKRHYIHQNILCNALPYTC
jgi:hypothetical protein